MASNGGSLDRLRRYKRRIAEQKAFIDQNKKAAHGQGIVKEKYWFSPRGEIFPVLYEHGDQALSLAREFELISPAKSISDYGFRSKWELADRLFMKKGWLRVQVYDAKSIGLNARPSSLESKSTEKAVLKVLPRPKEIFFQENWPYTLEYKAGFKDYKRQGWKKTIRRARRLAKETLQRDLHK